MITLETMKGWHWRAVMFLDGANSYSNHYVCPEEPRLIRISTGPSSGARGKRRNRIHMDKLFVDGHECKDFDAVIAALNAPPREPPTEEAAPDARSGA